ncbi:MAG: hypothetical protein HQ498_11535 [Pseudohongiella sp.]|nr:hypothetical protein [Pseudohongiella sp.]
MATMTFKIDDASTENTIPSVWVTITEREDGGLDFQVNQEEGIIGDLRGLFFDVADENILNTLIVNANSKDIRIGNDSISNLGGGATMSGLLGSDKGYDVGIEIGSSGIGKDDIRSYAFSLSSSARDLTLNDFSNTDFAARLTSVGLLEGSRGDSSKLLEITSQAIQLSDHDISLLENYINTGDLLEDLNLSGSSQITNWSGGDAGSVLMLDSNGDTIATVQLNADGSYTVDASLADTLSEGEILTYNLQYSAQNQAEATSWSSDSAGFEVSIIGVNDGPEAEDDAATVTENNQAAGSVLLNDSDIDRLDTLGVSAWDGGDLGAVVAIDNAAGANLKLNADGTYVLDASQADALSAGETITQLFTYTVQDNHGATDTATLEVSVTGVNDGPEAEDDEGGELLANAVTQGNVLSNDSDLDRLDVLAVSAVGDAALNEDGSLTLILESGALLTMNADGSYSYDTNGAFDSLYEGETASDSFTYAVTDGQGGSDVASVSFLILGQGSNSGDDDTGGDNDGNSGQNLFPDMLQDISNVVLYLDDGDTSTDIIKIKLQPEGLSIKDVDELNIAEFISGHGNLLGNNNTLVGISIHAGQEYPNEADYDYTAQGEGAFYFLLDRDTPIEAVGTKDHGWTSDWSKDDAPLTQEALDTGLTIELLGAHTLATFNNFDGSFWS